jgi:AmmeMemoRadiSam system protein B/AmmeMemoRadiSam system protein A
MSTAIRPAAVAGMFYPAAAPALAQEVDRLLAAAPREAAPQPPKMLVVPHAGYVYSGAVAARAYALLAPWRERIRRVVLLGPTHRVAVRGLALPSVAAFETPLGRVALDTEAIATLARLPQVQIDDEAHALEHALEVQLPFLQRALGTESFTLVPLAVGRASAAQVHEAIERVWGGAETLIVISTDLSHYLPYAQAQTVDRATADAILRLDTAIAHDRACGATPLAGALLAARAHGLAPLLLDLRNSGDTAGDRSRVVGYAAFAFDAAEEDGLGKALLGRARNAIAGKFGLPGVAAPDHAALAEPGASFVTLHRRGRLRGCVGTLEARRSLGEDVHHHALAAAFHDARFAPLAQHEFVDLEIEVSLIGASSALAAESEREACAALEPGVDGVILAWRGRRATFLPQVWEQLPQPEDFLAELKRKAGLAPDFWAPDLRVSRYSVRKFGAAGAPS